MDFFDEVSKTISKTANRAGKKASELAESAKIKFALANLQSDLDELYEKLGRCRYEALTGDFTDCSEREDALIKQIDSVKDDMELLKCELAKAKKERTCPECGKSIGNVSFCPYCGAKID